MKKFLLSAAMVAAVAMTVSAADETPAYYMVGRFNEWSNGAEDAKFEQVSDNVYQFEIANMTIGDGFAITDGTWDYKLASDGTLLKVKEMYNLVVNGGENITFGKKYLSIDNATFTLTMDEEQPTLYVTGDLVEDPNYVEGAEPLYLMGSITSWGFEENQLFTFDDESNMYSLMNVVLTCDGENLGEYKIAGKDWSPNFGKGEDTMEINDNNNATTLYKAGNPDNCKINLNGTFNFYVTMAEDGKSIELEVYDINDDPYAGINNVEADNNAETVYYTLQGVRVDAPANGLYIVKQGNKVSKMFIK